MQLLIVEMREPNRLPEIRALARGLEVHVLGGEVLLGAREKVQFTFRVVDVEQVFDNGAGFPECDARVGVFDSGGAVFG